MKKTITSILLIMSLVLPMLAQKRKPKPQPKPSAKVIFAVLNDGGMLEPFARVVNGALEPAISGSDEQKTLVAFNKTYYKPKTVYNLIFGGNVAGTVSVVKNDPTAECASNMAEAVSKSAKAKLKGFVMALATDITPTKSGSGLRRMPTFAERAEIDKLVIEEFAKNNVSGKKLEYHNLTTLDIDNDKVPEFVGSYWMASSPTERALLFIIAEKGSSGKYSLGHSEFRTIKKEEVMSADLKDVDEGVYHELLLDVLDYNNDGVAEIFTYVQSFEGAGFNSYQRKNGTWERILEASNYHCAY